MEYNIVASGIGGQGLVLFSEILAKSMLADGMNTSFYVHSGLAQLGGSVRSHIRYGERICPKISQGCADTIVSLEMAEILHAVSYLKKGGAALISEVQYRPYHSRLDPEAYPSKEQIGDLLREAGAEVTFIPAREIAEAAGHYQVLNMVMLGALVAHTNIVETESAVTVIRENIERGGDINVEAFWKGYEFIKGRDYV